MNKLNTKDKANLEELSTLDSLIKDALRGNTKLSITQFRELCNIPKAIWYRKMQEPKTFQWKKLSPGQYAFT